MTTNQKELIKKALIKHPGEILKYCGDKASWENSFTTENIKGKPYLFFWYNLESGHTLTESILIKKGE